MSPSRLALAALLALAPAASALAQETERTVSVSATGEVSAAPDSAEVTLSVTRRAETASAASAATQEAAAAVVDALTTDLVEPRDLRTLGVGLFPVYDHENRVERAEPVAYEARRDYRAVVRGIDRLGDALDAAVAAGANEISGVQLVIADRKALETEARRAAFELARAKAETLAAAAGIQLGDALRVAEGAPVEPGPGPMMMMRAEASDAIAPGELTVSVTVTAVFALESSE